MSSYCLTTKKKKIIKLIYIEDSYCRGWFSQFYKS